MSVTMSYDEWQAYTVLVVIWSVAAWVWLHFAFEVLTDQVRER